MNEHVKMLNQDFGIIITGFYYFELLNEINFFTLTP